MQSHHELNRREFLGAAGALTVATIAGGSISPAAAAEAGRAEAEEVLKEIEAKGEKFLTMLPKEARFLKMLITATRAQNILEIGTAEGYVTIWLALGAAQAGGRVTTVEIVPERVQTAKGRLDAAQLSKHVTTHTGDAHEIVPKLEGVYDFVLLDADKSGNVDYFTKLFPKKLAPGGLIVAHNAVSARDSMKDYLDLIDAHAELDSVLVSVAPEESFAVSCRHRTK